MRIVETWSLEPGMKTAEPIYAGDMLLLKEGTTLSRDAIRRIAARGIDRVAVLERDEAASAVPFFSLRVPSFVAGATI